MQTYIILMKMTEEGLKVGKDTPRWIKKVIENSKRLGECNLKGFYKVMGDYDFVSLIEVSDDKTALAFVMSLSSTGYVRTTSLKAYTLDQLDEALGKLS
ncbi:hypothetical protein CH333_02500 [candidate division WOR-3 bacterium JGI_Cruoil_03_44_89]|uniref:GYD family protein n=1 Tax=candidate division WOR-3 bacterium JGI_Cruoil_03_44_89 TaxID=1973748 RepID=A0A235BWU0_UNCW3|nr:MAG: hypothetical protein CH333_02500 [candidate division WOR-3 bacterium JGI_Cruoil_03_44_89]